MNNNTYFKHLANTGDDKVDQIFFVFRSAIGGTGGHKYSMFDPNDLYWENPYLTSNGSTYITPKSGTVSYKAWDGPGDGVTGLIPNMAHEYIHYCINGNHWDQGVDPVKDPTGISDDGNIKQFNLMCSTGAGGVSTYERYRLGWLNPTVVTDLNKGTFTLHDSHRANEAIMIPLRYDTQGWSIEYYWLENYVTQNEYAGATPSLVKHLYTENWTHGLLVYHIKQENWYTATDNRIDIVCADGRWQWKLTQGQSTPDYRGDDKIARDYPTYATGKDGRNYIIITVGSTTKTYVPLVFGDGGPDDPIWWCAETGKNEFQGDNKDFFKEGYADVFDRYSNPAASLGDGTLTNVGFQITNWNSTDKTYTLNIQTNFDGVNTLRPAKPENLKVDFKDVDYPILSWTLNPNSYNATGFKIYRAITDYYHPTPVFSPIATVDVDGAWWYTDLQVGSGGWDKAYYNVTALNGTQESLPSDTVHVDMITHYNKKATDNAEVKVLSNKLLQNYPNPFNPVTNIYYTVKANSIVKLHVFDILGHRVTELVNEVKPAGEYTTSFDGSGFPSGMYIYKLQCGSYSETKKMLLMK